MQRNYRYGGQTLIYVRFWTLVRVGTPKSCGVQGSVVLLRIFLMVQDIGHFGLCCMSIRKECVLLLMECAINVK